MSDAAIHERARQAGIAVDWTDAADRSRRVSTDLLRRILEALEHGGATHVSRLITATQGKSTAIAGLHEVAAAELTLEDGTREALSLDPSRGLPPIDRPGYHQLRYGDREVTLAVAPQRCLTIADVLANHKSWGLAVQIYSLRRAGDGGIGDTSALSALARTMAGFGANAISLSPAHSLFPHDLSRFGPYSPSNRLFLNPLLADPATVLGASRVAAVMREDRVSEATLIEWPRAAAAKYGLFRRLFDDFALQDLAKSTPLAARFDEFVREGGTALDQHARFEAQQGNWAAPVLYYAFLQWIAFSAFGAAQASAKAAGMLIGLIGDLAIGVERGGAQVGTRPQDFLHGLSIGAPPDAFNPHGQDWGLTTLSPYALAATGYAPFIATLRATMRWCGGLRIDHAMGLMRLWLVPWGRPPSEGAYLAYPIDDLMRLLALESHRNACVVIGEDLGTVPPEFRQRCHAAGISGMDVLWFQRGTHGFLPPADWRRDAVAMTSTHDLPTVAGWWKGADLELRRSLGTEDAAGVDRRASDRGALWQAFTTAGSTAEPPPQPDRTDAVVDAAVDFVTKTPSPLVLVPIEDLLGGIEQPNLPGTTDEHPNWARRFGDPVDELLQQSATKRRLELLANRKS